MPRITINHPDSCLHPYLSLAWPSPRKAMPRITINMSMRRGSLLRVLRPLNRIYWKIIDSILALSITFDHRSRATAIRRSIESAAIASDFNGMFIMISSYLLLSSMRAVYAQNCGCSSELCCNKYGFCGSGNDYRGDGCKEGPCSSNGSGSDCENGVASIISKEFIDRILAVADNRCAGRIFYTYNDFISVANAYSGTGEPLAGSPTSHLCSESVSLDRGE